MIISRTMLGGVLVAGIFVALVVGNLIYNREALVGNTPMAEQAIAESESMPRFTTGDLEIAIATRPATPRVGDNALIIELIDKDGKPVSDAAIDAYAEMPAMGAMSAMRAPAGLTQTGPGRYEGELNLAMRGEWPLTVKIGGLAQGDRRLQFDLATDRTGLEIAAGGAPVGGFTASGVEGSPADENTIMVDNRRRQMIGVEMGVATHRRLSKAIRAVGEVTFDETRLSQITLKYDAYIGELKANYVGTEVAEGQVLFTVYSPELLAAQQEYLEIRKRHPEEKAANRLLKSAHQRLRLWDMSPQQIKALEQRGEPQDYIPVQAPSSGTLIQRYITTGGAAKMGQTLLTIADLSSVWVEVAVFEADLELIERGMSATVTLPYLAGRTYAAEVDYVYPVLDGETRTGRLRLSLDNSSGELKPGMYAEVTLQADIGHRLSVPEEAIIYAGNSRVVFVDLGSGRLKPTWIKAGRSAHGFVEVLQGLSLGDRVVTSGNFLIAAETRLKTGIEQW